MQRSLALDLAVGLVIASQIIASCSLSAATVDPDIAACNDVKDWNGVASAKGKQMPWSNSSPLGEVFPAGKP